MSDDLRLPVTERQRSYRSLYDAAEHWKARAVKAEAEREALREALTEFGSSRVRDRIAAIVECNADILQDALQREVSVALAKEGK